MLAVDAGEEPVEKEEVELLLDPILFGRRWRMGKVKFEDQHRVTPGVDAKALAVAIEYLLKRYPSSLRGAPGGLLKE